MAHLAQRSVIDMHIRYLIIRHIKHKGACYVKDIAQEFSATKSRITYHLKILKHEGRIHISEWKSDTGGTPRALWSMGNSPDADRPSANQTRHMRRKLLTIIKIQPDIASSWLQQQPYQVVRKYIRIQRSGGLGVRQNTSASYRTETADSGT